MFVGIANTPRDYAWGSVSDIAGLLGRRPSGGPEAEYWLGTHHGSPSALVDDADGRTLRDITELPFIMKVLAAETPVSLQAHPSPAQAVAGFARENAQGIPLDAPHRNYKDDQHKPELVYAVSERFDALCGFRAVAESREVIAALGPSPLIEEWLSRLDASLPDTFAWLLSGAPEIGALRDFVVTRSAELVAARPAAGAAENEGIEYETVAFLAQTYPGDAGILSSLLLNRVVARRGEVLYLPSGNIHSYMRGLGIEVLAASDNVLRGGLTPKHVDVAELLEVLDFRPLPVPFLEPLAPSSGVEIFRPDVPDFELVVVRPAGHDANFTLDFDAIALCTDGPVSISGARGSVDLAPGDAVYVTQDESALEFTGSGTLFLTTRAA